MCPFSSDGTLDDEYVPDEGLPAVSVFSFLYRDMGWLLENGVLTSEKPAKEPSVLTSDVSYERDSDVGSVFRSPAMMSCDFPRFQHKASISHILSSEPGPVIGKLDRRRIFVETNSKSGFVSLDQDLSVESLNKGVLRLLTYWGLNAPVGSFEVVLSSGVYHRSSITKEDLHSICGIRLLV